MSPQHNTGWQDLHQQYPLNSIVVKNHTSYALALVLTGNNGDKLWTNALVPAHQTMVFHDCSVSNQANMIVSVTAIDFSRGCQLGEAVAGKAHRELIVGNGSPARIISISDWNLR